MLIYKILLEDEFSELNRQCFSLGSQVDRKDGFIHFSKFDQVEETLGLHFSFSKSVYILGFDSGGMKKLVWEKSRNNELFPHLYGKLYAKDICKKIFVKRQKGKFFIPNNFLRPNV